MADEEDFLEAFSMTINNKDYVPGREILLRFDNDSGAEKFQEWLFHLGRTEFERWLKKNS